MDIRPSRRDFFRTAGTLAAAAGLPASLLTSASAIAADAKVLTIAYHTALPSWDPTVTAVAVNPTVQSIYKSVFDTYIDQNPDLSFRPGLLTKWGWNADRTKIELEVRKGAFWHDGSPVTPEDVVWSLERAGDPKTGNPIQFVWGKIGNFKVDGQKITADVKEFEPTLFKWMAFLTAYVLPKKAYTAAGAQGWEDKPIGSGPYMVDKLEKGAYVRLKAFPKYWGPKPAFETVIFKFVTDPTARVAEIESGGSDLTLEIPYEEYNRLTKRKGFGGSAAPVSDVGMIFISNKEPMLDENVRLAMIHAVDKKAIVDKLLLGYGVPIDTLQAPQYAAFDKSITVKYDPNAAKALLAKSGYSTTKPVKFTIQTTRGYKPKDYEMIQAIVGMWRKVGIEANIETYEIAKHFELRARHELAPAAFYNWGNAIGDPATSTGFSMFSHSPHSAWRTEDVDKLIGPLWGEKDEAKRIAGYQVADRYIAEHGLVLPLLQYVQPVVYRKGLKFTPHIAGFVLPQNVTPA
ncbi:MAG: peptide ABC transporter substrate-binding protein [Burkholderiales bacterium]|nr:peptide ABC transporter substrate-binding protein [Burkholderiales bacterium]